MPWLEYRFNVVQRFEPRHDKTNKVSVRPVKTQISLGIRPVWSESSLSAWRNLRSLATHSAHSVDSDQTGRMPRLIWVITGRTLTLLVLSCSGSFTSLHFMVQRFCLISGRFLMNECCTGDMDSVWLNYLPISAYSGLLKFDMKMFVNVLASCYSRREMGASVYFGHISSFFFLFHWSHNAKIDLIWWLIR